MDDVASWLIVLLDHVERVPDLAVSTQTSQRTLARVAAERRIVERCISVYLLAEVEPDTYRSQLELAELVLADLAWGHRYDAAGWCPEWAVMDTDLTE
jgi:hypothetical protein